MTFGEAAFGETPFGEAGETPVVATVEPGWATAAGLPFAALGDTYAVTPTVAVAVAQGFSPGATQEATINVLPAVAQAVGLSPILSGVALVISVARAKAAGISPVALQIITGGTDSTNAQDGRTRGGSSSGTTTRPVAPVPPGLTLGERVDKVAAYPTPTMVNGRPT